MKMNGVLRRYRLMNNRGSSEITLFIPLLVLTEPDVESLHAPIYHHSKYLMLDFRASVSALSAATSASSNACSASNTLKYSVMSG